MEELEPSNFVFFCWECKTVQLLWITLFGSSFKIKHRIDKIDQFLPLDINSKELKTGTETNTCPFVSVAVLFTIVTGINNASEQIMVHTYNIIQT